MVDAKAKRRCLEYKGRLKARELESETLTKALAFLGQDEDDDENDDRDEDEAEEEDGERQALAKAKAKAKARAKAGVRARAQTRAKARAKAKADTKAAAKATSEAGNSTWAASWTQSGVDHSAPRATASEVLGPSAQKLGSSQLAALEVRVRFAHQLAHSLGDQCSDPDAVSRAIDGRIAQLLREGEVAAKSRSLCAEDMRKVSLLQRRAHEREARLAAKQEEFRLFVAGESAQRKLLGAALIVLEQFYGDHRGYADAWVLLSYRPQPSKLVLDIIRQVRADSKAVEAEAFRLEEKDVSPSETQAHRVRLGGVPGCQAILTNFEARRAAREREIGDLRQAKAALLGPVEAVLV